MAQQCPAMVALHKSTPVQIHNIIITPSNVVIDDYTKLNLSVVCIPKTGETSRYLRLNNKKGGWNYDIDEYGFKHQEFENAVYQQVECWETQKEIMEEELEEDLKTSNPIFFEVIKNKYERSFGDYVFKLEMYNLKRAGQPSPYNRFIQLAVSSSNSYRRVEYTNYDETLSKSMDSLISKLFSLNNNTIRIGSIKVEKEGVNSLNSISPKINHNQFPVASIITVESISGDLPIFKNTGIHIIENCTVQYGSIATRVHFRGSSCSTRNVHSLIESLKKNLIGKHLSIETNRSSPRWLSSVPNSVKGTILVDGNRITCYTVEDRKKWIEINCYYIPIPDSISQIHVEVHPIGHAIRN
ncbi:hypothetical protein GCK72_003078 [Caenorhabditis remanei]|uniref:Uncharacterized protein n=1 Tax=Caenorhabditis remanei TaxID=31234 RepID=A0A6A5HYF2_CAERE|nr:hypothetical protein GCK72_003078 [Caenorhabditis remanei]KAF1771252.1 hypothetical protein GCK72_003078 [Caenorhabditis remanei]